MKCPLTPDCSRAGAVPATQRTSSDPALFSAPDPTHYREFYYHMTTSYQPSQEAQKCARPLSNLKAGSGNETRIWYVWLLILPFTLGFQNSTFYLESVVLESHSYTISLQSEHSLHYFHLAICSLFIARVPHMLLAAEKRFSVA